MLSQLCPTLCDPMDCSPPGFSIHGDSPYKNTGVGCQVLLQGIFPSQGLNPGLPHCRQILYHLSHQGSPWILEWVAYPFSRGSSWPRNRTGISCIAGGFFTSWATREAYSTCLVCIKHYQILWNQDYIPLWPVWCILSKFQIWGPYKTIFRGLLFSILNLLLLIILLSVQKSSS